MAVNQQRVKELIERMASECYDDLTERKELRRVLEITPNRHKNEYTIRLLDPGRYPKVLIWRSRERYVYSEEDGEIRAASKELTRDNTQTVIIYTEGDEEYRYLTAQAGDVYAPLLERGE